MVNRNSVYYKAIYLTENINVKLITLLDLGKKLQQQFLKLVQYMVLLTSSQTIFLIIVRSSRPDVFCKKGVLRNFTKFTGKHLCQSLYFNKVAGLRPEACNFIKIEALARVFSCEFGEFSKNTSSYRTPSVTASAQFSDDNSI